MDGTIPRKALPQVLRGMEELSQKHGLRVANVFHAGDGNLHPLILFDANEDNQFDRAEAGGKMPAGTADAVQQIAPKFVAQLRQAIFRQQTQLLGGIYQRQGRVFGNIKTHQRLIFCLFIALNNVIRERFQCRSIQRLCGQLI